MSDFFKKIKVEAQPKADTVKQAVYEIPAEQLDYAAELIQERIQIIHKEAVEAHLIAAINGKTEGVYEQLGEGTILSDGHPLTRDDLKIYAKEHGIQLRTQEDKDSADFHRLLNGAIRDASQNGLYNPNSIR